MRVVLVLGFLFIFGFFAGSQFLESWSKEKITTPGEVQVELRPGMPLRQLAMQLDTKGIINGATLFHIWIRMSGDYSRFQAGNYLFKGPISPEDVREKFKKGDIYIPLVLQVSVPEGFTLKMLNNRLAAKNVGKLHELERLVTDVKFIRSLGVTSSSLEGFTYPATYNFDKLPNGQDFYRQTIKTFFEKIPENYESDIVKLGLNLTQAVTFASLIELETMREEEKPLIAEVIWSRLKRGEPLGIDAAIIYGIPNYDGDLRWKDLKNQKNPYNTRLHRGLPPTPIGAVSRSSLVAVLNPSKLGYYYYVLDSEDQTRHVFSKTLNEHNQLVKKLLKADGVPTIRRRHEQEGTN
jgi:UPF0755 protein